MPKGTDDHVGFLAPQSKHILFASLRLSFSNSACDSALGASAMVYADDAKDVARGRLGEES